MAKQTFTTGQVLTAAQMTSLQQTAMLGGNATAKTISYTLVAADAGTTVAMSNAGATTITVNTSLFSAGDIVTIYNQGAGVCTITAGTATVNTSGSLVLAQYQGGVLYFISASAAVFFQFATPASGDIEGVTAGVGISGGGTSGTVTVTNSMATAMTTSGDLIQATGSGTFARLATGTNGQYLTTNGTTNSWGTISAGGNTLITSGTTFSGTSQTISSIPQTYKHLMFTFWDMRTSSATGSKFHLTFNGAGGSYTYRTIRMNNITVSAGVADPDNELVIGTSLVATTYATTGVIEILDYASTTNYKTGTFTAGGRTDAGNQLISVGNFQNNSNTAISSIVLNVNNAWTNGYWELWGVA
jgi:hypothetical protein